MKKTIKMRVNITLGTVYAGQSADRSVEFEMPVSDIEKAMLEKLPQCDDGKTTELKEQIPIALYDKICSAAMHEVENVTYMENYNNGYYELDAQKWFAHDLDEGNFARRMPNGQYKIADNTTELSRSTLYNKEDQELLNIWYDYEAQQVKKLGIYYLRSRYEQELADQTDFFGVTWSLEF